MKGWLAAAGVIGAAALAARRGLRQLPEPFEITAQTQAFRSVLKAVTVTAS